MGLPFISRTFLPLLILLDFFLFFLFLFLLLFKFLAYSFQDIFLFLDLTYLWFLVSFLFSLISLQSFLPSFLAAGSLDTSVSA
jgi:hypothetical protein